jgi:hypothetical protein
MLFHTGERTNLAPAKASDLDHSYVDNSARPAFAIIRELLESWYADYPDVGKDDLAKRFHTSTLSTYSGAFFELYCHALLRAHGYRVELHPETATGRCPDFLVCDDSGPIFYLEATVALPATEDQATASRDDQLNDCINSMQLPNLFLGRAVRRYGEKQLSCKKLKDFLYRTVEEFARDETSLSSDEIFEYRSDDWEIDFRFFPCSTPSGDAESHRPLGVSSGPVSYPQPHVGLLKSLRKKAGKYGVVDLPFLVAVNCLHEHTENEDIAMALLGSNLSFWLGPVGPQNTRISGVVVADHIMPWTVGSHRAQLWLNPFASHKLPVDALQLPRYSWNELGEVIRYQDAQAAADLLQSRRVSEAIQEERKG